MFKNNGSLKHVRLILVLMCKIFFIFFFFQKNKPLFFNDQNDILFLQRMKV